MYRLKWPDRLTIVRHAMSAFNTLRPLKEADPLYQAFRDGYASMPNAPETQELAREVLAKYVLDWGDYNTPLAKGALETAVMTGRHFSKIRRNVPDVIYVSPYLRTKETLRGLMEGWPELSKVEVIEEERIREREHGLMLAYSDWRVFYSLHPDQQKLRDREGQYYYRFPQGESIPDVRERNRSWLRTLRREFAKADVLAVTHHITILSMRANLERLGPEEYLQLDKEAKPINCGVTVYRGVPNVGRKNKGKIRLDSYNKQYY